MVLKYKEFFNESVINNDDDLIWKKINELRKNNPEWDLKIEPNLRFKNSYNARIFFKGEYYAGIKGPCSLLQTYEFFNNIIEKNK